MYTNDQTADVVRDGDGVDGQTTTDGPGGLDRTNAPVDATSGATRGRPKPNAIVLEALTGRAIVRIEVDGEIGPAPHLDDSDATGYDDVVISRLDRAGDRDRFHFSGTVADLEIVEGDVEVALDLHRDGAAGQGRPARLSIHAQGSNVDYGFAVSGGVEQGHEAEPGDGNEDRDEVATGTVSGSGVDEYRFTGEITEFEASTDQVLVLVNDRIVDPDELG